jgi:excisionase family DNA binding protein
MPQTTDKMTPDPKGLATLEQAAKFLAVGRSTIYSMMEHGELPWVKVRKCRRVPWVALRAFAEKCLVGAAG